MDQGRTLSSGPEDEIDYMCQNKGRRLDSFDDNLDASIKGLED